MRGAVGGSEGVWVLETEQATHCLRLQCTVGAGANMDMASRPAGCTEVRTRTALLSLYQRRRTADDLSMRG